MRTVHFAAGIPEQIQQLLAQRKQHADVIDGIDRMLDRVSSMLGKHSGPRRTARRSSPQPPALIAPMRVAKSKRRKRGSYAMTAEESILAFVTERGNPTTAEIRELWRSEGRKGMADNVLSRLVKMRRLKREPMRGERGSRYTVS